MKGLHQDDGSTRDASHFHQESDGIGRVVEHEEQQRGRERVVIEWQHAVNDQHRRPSHDMHVGYIRGDDLDSTTALQARGEVSGAGADIQQGTFVRQPFTHLLDQLIRATFQHTVE